VRARLTDPDNPFCPFDRNIDPVFALFIGGSAAVVRINRDEKAKGYTTQDSIESLKRRVAKATGLGS
jgi:hypothetical protein